MNLLTGPEIRKIRISIGATQTALAEVADVRKQTLCKIELGKSSPLVPTLKALQEGLRMLGWKPKKRGRK